MSAVPCTILSRDSFSSAGQPAEEKESRLRMVQGTADGPAGEEAGRIDEENEEDRQRPPELARRRLDLQQVERQSEQQRDGQREPVGDRSAAELCPYLAKLKNRPQAVLAGELSLQKR